MTFFGSAVTKSQYPNDNLPQIVFSGRSNVGKSSFINALLNRKKIARVSQTPGKTRLVNFFNINDECYFVDIPGYGYANVSKKQLLDFQVMIETYLTSPNIALCVLLLDSRRIPNEDDLLMYEYFKSINKKILLILTKSDKLSNNQMATQKKKIIEKINPRKEDMIMTFSSVTMANREKVLDIISNHISGWLDE